MADDNPEAAQIDNVDEKVRKILLLAENLDTKDLRTYLSQIGLDINLINSEGLSALELAVNNDNLKAVKTLIPSGANLNVAASKSALMMATRKGDADCLHVLINAGANVNQQDENGLTALMLASKERKAKCVGKLLKAEVDVNMVDRQGMTALMYSTGCCHQDNLLSLSVNDVFEESEIVKDILQAGANPDIQDNQGRSALIHLTCHDTRSDSWRNYNVVRFLHQLILHSANVNLQDKNGMTALMHASRNKIKDCCDLLLQYNADITLQDKNKMTALTHAVMHDSFRCCELLIRRGVNLNAQDDEGRTALMYAILFSAKDCASLLAKQKLEVNVQDNDGRTALMYAVLHDSLVWDDLMERKDINISLQDKEGRTAVMYATTYFSPEELRSMHFIGSWSDVECTALVPFLKDVLVIEKMRGPVDLRVLSYKMMKMLENGADPILIPSHHEFLLDKINDSHHHRTSRSEEMLCMQSFLQNGRKELVRLFVCNGIVEALHKDRYGRYEAKVSPVKLAIECGHFDVIRYFIATCYLNEDALKEIRCAVQEDSEFSRDAQRENKHLEPVLQAVYYPWPLVKLAFIAVSSALGGGADREARISQAQLPPRLQRMLMFQEPVSRIPVSQWADIPLCFDPQEYETLPKARPLLYYWPFGRDIDSYLMAKTEVDEDT